MVLLAFVEQYWNDAEAGSSMPLDHYLERFPGHAEAIAREWLDLRGEGIEGDGRVLSSALRGARYVEEMAPWLRYVPDHFPALFR